MGMHMYVTFARAGVGQPWSWRRMTSVSRHAPIERAVTEARRGTQTVDTRSRQCARNCLGSRLEWTMPLFRAFSVRRRRRDAKRSLAAPSLVCLGGRGNVSAQLCQCVNLHCRRSLPHSHGYACITHIYCVFIG